MSPPHSTVTMVPPHSTIPAKPVKAVKSKSMKKHHKVKLDIADAVKEMVSKLTEDEIEVAARSSYRYQVASQQGNATADFRQQSAESMARRHFIAEKGNLTKALKQMKRTIKYRQDYKVEEVCQCFQDQKSDSEVCAGIQQELGKDGAMFIRGYDLEHRANLHFVSKNNIPGKEVDPKSFVNAHIYLMERALACTERASDGKQEMVNAMVDFEGYDKDLAPPIGLAKDLLFLLRDHYPERLHRVYLIDAPPLFRAFWNIIRPFVDPVTKKKFQFITGDKEKVKAFRNVVDPSQSMPYMSPHGKLSERVDMEKFLHRTPYDFALDEE